MIFLESYHRILITIFYIKYVYVYVRIYEVVVLIFMIK